MNIEFHLMDPRSPCGFDCVVARNRREIILETDTIAAVVTKLIRSCGTHRLNVVRIEAHGRVGTASAIVNGIDFGCDMNATTVRDFQQIRSLWSRDYVPAYLCSELVPNYYPAFIPRIEMHGCEVVPGCNLTLQALANAANAPVFGSSSSQDVNANPGADAFAIEGPVFRFDPPHPTPYR